MSQFERLWQILDIHPRLALVERPTPVRRLTAVLPGRELWLKDDSSTHPVYGGNKPRKLEYLLAAAKASGKDVLTFGAESSNHALACVYHGATHGVRSHLVLTRAADEMTADDRALTERKLRFLRERAASITVARDYKAATYKGFYKWAMSLGRLVIIPPGGSNALGTLGYVRAGLELAEQVARGELPEPELVYVPLGTGGTALGLAIGLAAAGFGTRVVAVKVVPGPINELARLKVLARGIGRLLPGWPRESLTLENLSIERDALGGGYSVPTPEAMSAVARWYDAEGLVIENTYTGKTAALLERHGGGKRALFWLTYSQFRG